MLKNAIFVFFFSSQLSIFGSSACTMQILVMGPNNSEPLNILEHFWYIGHSHNSKTSKNTAKTILVHNRPLWTKSASTRRESFKGRPFLLLELADFGPLLPKVASHENWVLEAICKYFLTREKAGKSLFSLLLDNLKKNIFQALAKKIFDRAWKKFEIFLKKWIFSIWRF